MFLAEDLREIYEELKKKKITVPHIADINVKKKARTAFQETLLQQTVESAYKKVPYYGKILKKLKLSSKDFTGIDDLRKMPLLSRQTLNDKLREFIDPIVDIISVRKTSGTTGPPLRIYVSREEMEALMYLGEITRVAGGLISGEYALHICVRRLPLVVSQQTFTINHVWIKEDPLGTYLIIQNLLEKHLFSENKNQISVLILPMPRLLRILTREMRNAEVSPRSTGVRKILVAGGYVSESLREEAKHRWNAEIWDTYSLTEVCGRASDCSSHHLHHFDITMIPEVIDPHTKAPLGYDKEGLLALTTLHPFQQAMPLIRYVTDDLAILTDEKCECGYSGISIKKIIGRISQCIDLSDLLPKSIKTRWFSTNSMREILEKESSVLTKLDNVCSGSGIRQV